MQRLIKQTFLIIMLAMFVSGCATTSNPDPLESMNRGIYKFNDVTDRYVAKPVAKAYKTVTPSPVRKGVNNFFSNLGTLTTVLNDILQLKFGKAFSDAGRFVINSTFGVAGLIDIASVDKIDYQPEDFGQTLGHYGVGNGPYLVLPFVGPSTLRDFTGRAVDLAATDPITVLHNKGHIREHNQVRFMQLLDTRAALLDATDLADGASLDPYIFIRDAYLQRRASQVQDNIVPPHLLDGAFEPDDEDAELEKYFRETSN